jgi:hypothetical protein
MGVMQLGGWKGLFELERLLVVRSSGLEEGLDVKGPKK